MQIQKVAVLGAGAVGSYLIWGLTNRPGIELGVIAEGGRAERLSTGISINGKTFKPAVWTPEEAHNADLIFVCLKYGALEGALDSLRRAVGPNTTVMSLMNGVDSETVIGKTVGNEHVLPSLIKIASRRIGPEVQFNPESTIGIIFGEYEAPFESERVKAICKLFEGTGIHYRTSEVIREEIWSKFRLNVCDNLPQAILGVGLGCYNDSAHVAAIREGLRRELEAVAAAKGIDFSKLSSAAGGKLTVPPSTRYSTLQDLDAKRPTEIDMFSGALMRMGKELGIPTPYNECVFHLVKALEEKNAGLFDYEAHA